MDESGIGKRLRNIRRSRMWNQHKLAEEAGVSPTTVSGIETGRISTPHFGTLHKLAQALDVNPQVLFSSEDAIQQDPPTLLSLQWARSVEEEEFERRLEEASLEGIEALSGQLKEERERLQRLYGEFPRGSEQRRFIKQQLRDVSAQSESVTTSMMFHPGKGTEGYKDDHEEA
ncbi:MAG: helix-turn-helix transcriptional regulator [Actinobacteria bacterium]|nr:helix-turn-helix transcriptional regulator [Actinomycetota bacterium]